MFFHSIYSVSSWCHDVGIIPCSGSTYPQVSQICCDIVLSGLCIWLSNHFFVGLFHCIDSINFEEQTTLSEKLWDRRLEYCYFLGKSHTFSSYYSPAREQFTSVASYPSLCRFRRLPTWYIYQADRSLNTVCQVFLMTSLESFNCFTRLWSTWDHTVVRSNYGQHEIILSWLWQAMLSLLFLYGRVTRESYFFGHLWKPSRSL